MRKRNGKLLPQKDNQTIIKKKKTNKKVRNATKSEHNGVQYRSKLEAFCARHLDESGISFSYESISFTLLEGFEYKGEKIRPITYKPDFIGEGFIIETKGYANDSWPLRLKLFKKMMLDNNVEFEYFIAKNQKEILSIIDYLKGKSDEEK